MAKGFATQPERPRSSRTMKVTSVAEATALTEHFQEYFGSLEDPRVERTRAHLLIHNLYLITQAL